MELCILTECVKFPPITSTIPFSVKRFTIDVFIIYDGSPAPFIDDYIILLEAGLYGFFQSIFSLFCHAIISFSCVFVQESATDRGKRGVGSWAKPRKTGLNILPLRSISTMVCGKISTIGLVLADRYQQYRRYGIIIKHFLLRFCYGI